MFKVNNRFFFFSILLILLILGGCSQKKELFSGDTSLTKDNILDFKKPFQISDENIMDFVDPNQTEEKFNNVIEEISLGKKYNKHRIISKKDAEEDIDIYIKTLKDCYAGYLPHGGDARFEIAKENIKSDLKDQMKAGELKEIIGNHMSFVEDAHFTIGGKVETNIWYVANGINIGKDKNGYFNISNNKYIKNYNEIESLLQASLSKEKSIFYKLYSQTISETPKKLIYEDGTVEELEFNNIRPIHRIEDEIIFEERDNIAYLQFPRFYFPNERLEIKKILNAAEKMSKTDYSILDLRGNQGGNAILVGQWFEGYTGKKVVFSCDSITVANLEASKDNDNGQTCEEFMEYSNAEVLDDNHLIEKHSDKTIEKDGLLIVLTDSGTMSAGEKLVDALHHLDNTIFIGMPTRGCIISSACCQLPMENSRIPFSFGNTWSVYDRDYFEENRGFLPDIWVSDIDLEKLVEWLKD